MKVLLLFAVLLFQALLAVSSDGSEQNFLEVRVEPALKYYDSDGRDEMLLPLENAHHRSIRRATTCKPPAKITDSRLDCRLYPRIAYCNQTCMFGYTYSEGVTRHLKCNYKENKWIPQFESCRPFVDCTLTLGTGGKYKCFTHFMDRGPICKVSCAHYEDIPAVPEAAYECDIQGKWTPKLPFCAKAGTGVKLVPAPRGVKYAKN